MSTNKIVNKKIKIVIDPGHGDNTTRNKYNTVDPGTLGLSYWHEKDYNLQIASDLGSELETEYGYKIIYTRKADIKTKKKYVVWRVDYANNRTAHYFISIHLNSFANSRNKFSVHYQNNGPKSTQGKKFAESVVNAVTPRGFNKTVVQADNLYVTRKTDMPAILVECGNIKNIRNENNIFNILFIKEFAIGIDKYIQSYEKEKVKSWVK